MLILPRRKLLLGMAAGICAPAIVRAQTLLELGAGSTKKAAAAAGGYTYTGAHAAAAGLGSPVTTPALNSTGADFAIAATSGNAGVIGTVSDSNGNSWNNLTTFNGAGSGTFRFAWSRMTTVGAGHTFILTGAVAGAIAVACFSGSNATPFDVQGGAVSTTGTGQPGSLTPSQNNSLIVCGVAPDSSSGPYTIDSGFSITDTVVWVSSNNEGIGLAYLIQGTASAVNPTWTMSSNVSAGIGIASFK